MAKTSNFRSGHGSIHIEPDKEISRWLEGYLGLQRYAQIIKQVRNTNVEEDTEFQRLFNGFFKVRRNAEWCRFYYGIFERMKKEKPDFGMILNELYHSTGQVEASFSSKMLATLNNDMPIWDQYVLKNLGLAPSGGDPGAAIRIYADLVGWYHGYVDSKDGKECIRKFDEMLPDYTWVSDVKKIDYFLWGMR